MPNTLKEIKGSAFMGCDALTELTLTLGTVSVGSMAFSYCTALTGVTIPAGVTKINQNTFSGCHDLTIRGWRNSAAHSPEPVLKYAYAVISQRKDNARRLDYDRS